MQTIADRVPNPGPSIPHIELWQKASVIGAVEFVLFAVPFAARRRKSIEGRSRVVVKETPKEAVESAPKVAAKVKVKEGGWQRRRQLYGPTGRKHRNYPESVSFA
jgi:hypothetical protein